MTTIKAVSLYEPYAWLIAIEEKKYETRDWTTKHRGLLAIHPSSEGTDVEQWLHRSFVERFNLPNVTPPLGAFLCVVELKHVYHTQDVVPYISEKEQAFGNWAAGRAAWELEMVRVFNRPIKGRGKPGLFEWECPVAV